jgi:type II secretory pathway pseudopilin PulG
MRSLKSKRGSILIVAAIFASLLAIALTSYIKLALGASKLANRSFYMNAAQNLVDTGFERALWSLNNELSYPSPANWTTGGFAARTGFSNEYQGTFPSSATYYTLSGGAQGQVNVWVGGFNAATQTWHAVARATITLGDGTTLFKMAETYLQQRSWGERGLIARNGMSFNGNTRVDAWHSHSDTASTADDVLYSTGVAVAEATIASPELVSLQNADIYGYAAIGTSDMSGLTVGATGRLAGNFAAGTGIDATRVTHDFTASFPDVPATTNSGSTAGNTLTPITNNLSLPQVGDTLTGSTYYYYVSSMSLNASKTLEVGVGGAVKVVMVFSSNVSMGGNSQIIIHPGSSLTIYAAGDFEMGGLAGIQNGTTTNPSNPVNFTLLGTRTEAQIVAGQSMQVFNVRGTGYLSAVIFAPNANLTVNGTGDTYGSLVGNRVDMVGSGNFHQDLSLANIRTSGMWKMLKWRELATQSDRSAHESVVAF